MTWVIERLTSPAQIDDVVAIEHESFTNPWTRDMYVAELDNQGVSYCYLARNSSGTGNSPGEVVGFCSFWHVADELHINNLAVLPRHRRGGVATALLMHAMCEGARLGATRATLEVRASNDPARLLYERLGFTVAGIRRAYYTKPVEDAIILWRDGLSDFPRR
jgi:ribosomal-protein-alanine N-acetyltransferase